MVGIPRSKGCRICVQRRVRCDLTKPFCKNCKKGNRPCPGYPADLKFQDEGEKIRKRYDQTAILSHEDEVNGSKLPELDNQILPTFPSGSTSTESQESWELTTTNPVGHKYREGPFFDFLEAPTQYLFPTGADDLLTTKELQLEDEEDVDAGPVLSTGTDLFEPDVVLGMEELATFGTRVYATNVNQNQLFSTFANALSLSHGRWLSHLPDMTGRSPLLDSAIRSVSLAHLGRLHNSDLFINEARPFYGKALRLMSRSLKDVVESMDPTVLCATMLLSFYEMFTSDTNESWVRHAGGAGALMKARGPQRHRYGFDREMFLAYRHTIIVEAFQNDEVCFLDEPDWREVSQQIHDDIRVNGVESTRLQIFDLSEEFYKEMAQMPALFRDARHLSEHGNDLLERYTFKSNLIQRIKDHRLRLKTTYVQFQASLRDIGHTPESHVSGDDVFPLYLSYVNIFVASSLTGYWTVLILVNTMLQQLQQDPVTAGMYKIEDREAANEICKTTDFMLVSSFLGPFFAIFGLRVCLHVYDEGSFERDWVIRKLNEIGQSKMRIAKSIPTFKPGTSMPMVRIQAQAIPRLEEH